MIDLAAVAIAIAVVVLVGYLIPTILQIKRTVAQSERVLARVNNELPGLLKDIRGTSENVRALTDQAKMGVDRASTLFTALGDMGQTVQQVHGAVRGRSGSLFLGLTSVLAGIKAASQKMKHRASKEGGKEHGK
ncbi:MAG: DUF948 domain-containing protein [Nitrospirales bacterium]|nr:DUF948 domain-containing protein [Nitrospira sp.]MDR4502606.1 DUF948 domain-containing protein [Nitrospirales bacterium]